MLGSTGMPHEEVWMVPITMTTGANPDFDDVAVKTWLTEKETNLELPANNEQWVLLNVKQVGELPDLHVLYSAYFKI